MLFELPSAEEIDALALTTLRFEVRSFSYDKRKQNANLNYSPCKGQMILTVSGRKGTILVRDPDSGRWTLPSGRIGAGEDVLAAARRVAKDECGVGVRSLELVGIYDVVWHFADVSVKRLHFVYSATTEDECFEVGPSLGREARFFAQVPESVLRDDLVAAALADCSTND